MDKVETAIRPCKEPGRASVEDGFVVLDGPDGVAITMTPDAAALTAESLRLAAEEAVASTANTAASGQARDEDGHP